MQTSQPSLLKTCVRMMSVRGANPVSSVKERPSQQEKSGSVSTLHLRSDPYHVPEERTAKSKLLLVLRILIKRRTYTLDIGSGRLRFQSPPVSGMEGVNMLFNSVSEFSTAGGFPVPSGRPGVTEIAIGAAQGRGKRHPHRNCEGRLRGRLPEAEDISQAKGQGK